MNQEELLKEISKPEFIQLAIGVLLIRILIWLLLANNIRKTLNLIDTANRCILPYQVWFIAIPLFNIYWNFEVVKRLRDSIINEFYDRKIAIEEQPTYKKGMLYAWIYLITNIPFPFPLGISGILIVLHFVTLVNYWFVISSYKRILIEHNKFGQKE